jgi:hypothetical protein
VTGYDPCRVAPFGNPRIKGCLHLPEAYRSLPRPSSLPRAKASTLRPFLLDFYFQLPTDKRRTGTDPFPRPQPCRSWLETSFPPTRLVRLVKEPAGGCPRSRALPSRTKTFPAHCRRRRLLHAPLRAGRSRRPRTAALPARRGWRQWLRAAGGEYRARTGDLLLAKQALSQLS